MSVLGNLTRLVKKRGKRRGKGYASGRGGHTSGRGHKGSKARLKVKITCTGTKHKKSLWQRLPTLRGKKKRLKKKESLTVNLDKLIPFIKEEGQVIDKKFLLAKGTVKATFKGEIKIVAGRQKLPFKVVFKLPVSQTVQQLNEKINPATKKAVRKKAR